MEDKEETSHADLDNIDPEIDYRDWRYSWEMPWRTRLDVIKNGDKNDQKKKGTLRNSS